MIVTNKDEQNGVVFNAKGDLISTTLSASDSAPTNTEADARIRFNTNGSITRIGDTVSGGTAWVETGVGWIGGGNYGISWTYSLTGPNSLPGSNRTFASRIPLSSSVTFGESAGSGTEESHSSVTVSIYNESTGVSSSYVVSLNAIEIL